MFSRISKLVDEKRGGVVLLEAKFSLVTKDYPSLVLFFHWTVTGVMIAAGANTASSCIWACLSIMPRFTTNSATINVRAVTQSVIACTALTTRHTYTS